MDPVEPFQIWQANFSFGVAKGVAKNRVRAIKEKRVTPLSGVTR